GQHGRGDEQVAALELDHAKLAGVECTQLLGRDVDALDLAAVFEMAGVLGLVGVQALALEQGGQLRLGFAAQARGLLLLALGTDALVLLALGADGIGLGEIDVALGLPPPAGRLRAGTTPALAPRVAAAALAPVRTAPGTRIRPGLATGPTRARGLPRRFGHGRGLEAQAQQLVSQ